MKTKTENQTLSDPLCIFEHMGAANAPRDIVDLPNGARVLVRGLTTVEYGRIQADIHDEDGTPDWEASAPLYLIAGALKPDGKQGYSEADAGKIMDTPRALTQPMVDKIIELTGVSKEGNARLAKNWVKMTAGVPSSD